MNTISTKIFASLILALCLSVGNANATTITYDFSGSSSGLGTGNLGISSATVISSGLSVSVEALDEFGAAGELARNATTGLGVVGEPGTGQETNQVGADSNGGEALLFDFAPNSVTILETVVFELGMEGGLLNVLADNVLLDTIVWTAATGTGATGNSEISHTFSGSLISRTAQSFTFQAAEDSFRVVSLSVQTVPEPASLVLCLLGLAGVSCTAKRRAR